ncbi:prepilin-type N-terminal cleavage/methylation domain-containing protein [Verrucomicrobiaceae bacterium R5-34]|uniref:Prepilin-type N-terminal cleavage/methylation domain-containing protein n=1 Tax=Oceaniferula flava TaxID=2800421 RepID=A0AAE2SAQ7_9BACT|nr:prepilin-type N-terminal cleavage/methylation domain-containing protein [Oceaniferula flavus]MBK1829167.1 prepilin-type N-terminal cleavage/methylation domain-containing protein [Verrucomicrobiaceae bacterium R5-34]MBK1853404.1 prepilin-type N-terminal cleavage/methylation domain-containing protein [Oceaniferula flavus]MBM1134709.1 prepilin-type N-terminal cleavage/methylation domain-containing protein [Oceaniferula flavus]
MKLPKSKSKGFTLVELLVVIAIIAVLAALATPAIMKGLTKASIVKAKSVCSNFETAVNNFENEYNYLPYSGTVPDDDNTDPIRSDEDVVAVLAGVEDTDSSDAQNFKGIRFFELGEPKGSSEASYKDGMKIDTAANTAKIYDPWGNTYYIVFDYGLDGLIDNPLEPGETVGGKKVIVYSYGPDEQFGTNKLNRDNATNF